MKVYFSRVKHPSQMDHFELVKALRSYGLTSLIPSLRLPYQEWREVVEGLLRKAQLADISQIAGVLEEAKALQGSILSRWERANVF